MRAPLAAVSEDPQEAAAPQAGMAKPGKVVWGDGQATVDGSTLRVKLAGGASAVFQLAP